MQHFCSLEQDPGILLLSIDNQLVPYSFLEWAAVTDGYI